MTPYFKKILDAFLPRIGVAQAITNAHKMDPWSAYSADFPDSLKPNAADPNGSDNMVFPIVAQIVNSSVGAMLGADGITIDVKGDNEDEAQAYLDLFLRRSRKNRELKCAALNGAVMGHVFLKMLVGADGQPSRFQCVDSKSVSVETDARDCTHVVAYTVAWTDTDAKMNYKEVTRQNSAGLWTITEYKDEKQNGRWEETARTEWPFAWSPIFQCQNLVNARGFWGQPDVTKAIIDQNIDLNMIHSNMARLLRNHANPKMIFTGYTGKDMEWSTDLALSLGTGATAQQMETNGAGASALDAYAKHLESLMHVTARSPEVASGKLEAAGNLSGVALKILYAPLIEKVSEKRLLMEEMLDSLCRHALELGGFPDREIEVVWPEIVPQNELEQRQIAQQDQQLGVVSKETVAKTLGYDYETEQEQIRVEGIDAGGAILSALNAN